MFESDPYFFSRSALKLRPAPWRRGRWRVETELQAFLYHGDYLTSSEWRFLSPQLSGNSRNRWDGLWSRTRETEVWGRIWRLYGAVELGPVEIAAGRMRNALGNARLFLSPLDRLDTLPTLVSESWERPGSETVRARWSPTDSWRWKAGYILGRKVSEDRSFVHVGSFLKEGCEIEALLARSWPRTLTAGLGLDYSLWEGQLRWQGTFNAAKEDIPTLDDSSFPPSLKMQTQTHRFSRHLVAWERAYGEDWVAALEYMRNGRGELDPGRYDFTRLLGGQDLYLARDYAGVYVHRRLSPLLSASLQWVAGLRDQGLAGTPEISFQSGDSSLEAKLFSSFYFGPSRSEFGQLKNRTHLALSWYF